MNASFLSRIFPDDADDSMVSRPHLPLSAEQSVVLNVDEVFQMRRGANGTTTVVLPVFELCPPDPANAPELVEMRFTASSSNREIKTAIENAFSKIRFPSHRLSKCLKIENVSFDWPLDVPVADSV